MARALAKPVAEIDEEQSHADTLIAAMRRKLTRPDGVFIDGLEPDGTQSTHASQQANAWALAVGVVPAQHVKVVGDYIVSLKNAMGVVYYRVLLDALHAAGRDQAFVDTLTDPTRPGYAQILKQGATFTWESWIAPQIGDSESHGWGATVLAVLQDDMLGVQTTAPGSTHVDVRVPHSSVTRAIGVVATQRGSIPVAWTRDASGRETISVTIPANVTATVTLDAATPASASEGGGPLDGDPGITNVVARAGAVTVTIGSGQYVFANAAPTHGLATSSLSSSSSTSTSVAVVAAVIAAALAGLLVFFLARRRRRAA